MCSRRTWERGEPEVGGVGEVKEAHGKRIREKSIKKRQESDSFVGRDEKKNPLWIPGRVCNIWSGDGGGAMVTV